MNRDFKQPQVDGEGDTKLDDIKRLLQMGETLYPLMHYLNLWIVKLSSLLEMENYILILDEVMNVIEQEKISKDDLKMLYKNKVIEVNTQRDCDMESNDYQQGYLKKSAI